MDTVAVHTVILEVSLVVGTVNPGESPSARLLAAHVLAPIPGPVGPRHQALAPLLVVDPLPLVNTAVRHEALSPAMPLALLPLALIESPVGKHVELALPI